MPWVSSRDTKGKSEQEQSLRRVFYHKKEGRRLCRIAGLILEHTEIEDQVPDNAMIVLVTEYDQELAKKNMELADANKEPGQTLVYVRF